MWNEIRKSEVLRYYGVFLALIHTVTWTFWYRSVPNYLADPVNSFCWPFVPRCEVIHNIPSFVTNTVLTLYLIASIVTALLFLLKKIQPAYWSLFGLFIFKLLIQISDYRLMGNYHYMPQLATLAYLFLPAKKQVISYLLVLFYFSAGTLKLNYEWLSGSALWNGLPFTDSIYLFQISLAFVVLLELLFVFGLLSAQKIVRWGTLSLFAVFHLMSWHWVGYFYPVVCFLMIGIFPLRWLLEKGNNLKITASGVVFLSLIAVAQVLPRVFSPDHTLYGKDRILSLNMIDARSECMGSILIYDTGSIIEYDPDRLKFGTRTHCDDIVYLNYARNLCRSYKTSQGLPRMDVFLVSRKTTDADSKEILNIKNFCEHQQDFL